MTRNTTSHGRWRWIGYIGAIAILALIVSKADLRSMADILRHADRSLLVAMVLLAHFQFVMAAYIWKRFLEHRGVSIPLLRLSRYYMVSNFFSTILPSRYSGDVYRAYAVGRESGKYYTAAASVLLERLAGIFVLLFMGLGASLFASRILGPAALSYSIAMVFGIFFSGVALLFTRKSFYMVERVLLALRLHVLVRPMEKFHAAVMEYRGHHGFLLKTNVIAFFIKMFAFVCIYLGALALGITLHPGALVLIMPLIYIAEAAPISIGGIGIREGAFVVFFTRAGLQYEQAFALSIIVLFGRFCCAMTGGFLYLASRRVVPAPDEARMPAHAGPAKAATDDERIPLAALEER